MARNKTLKRFGSVPQGHNRPHAAILTQTEITTFAGPLPPPGDLAKYDQVLPGLADRIVNLAERQSEHRQELERITIHGNMRAQRIGQVMAFVVVLLGMLIGGILVWLDKPIAGYVTLLTPLTMVAAAFFVARGQQARQLKRKRDELESSSR